MQHLIKITFLLFCLTGCNDKTRDYISRVTEHRKNIDALFADEKGSPLTDIDRAQFKGLEYFEINQAYSVTAGIEKFDSVQYLDLKHTLNRTYQFIKWGKAHFKLFDDSCHLTIYLTADKEVKNTMLFIPFKDASNGLESFAAGRYLDLEIPKDNMATIDFNLSYNPNCAYSDNWSCPLVPAENILQMAVRAGVKKFGRISDL